MYKGYKIQSIRILPNDKSTFITENDFRFFLEKTMIDRGGYYFFPNVGMKCPINTLVLFQYDGIIKATGVLIDCDKKTMRDEEDNEYKGYYKFDVNTISWLEAPIDKQMIMNVYPKFKGFNQSKQKIPMEYLNSIIKLIDAEKTDIEDDTIYISPDEVEIVDDLFEEKDLNFDDSLSIKNVIKKGAKKSLETIKKILYTTPSFINLVKSSIPEEFYSVVFTDEQKKMIKEGAVKLMTKKDGNFTASLVGKDGKILANLPIEKVTKTPELTNAFSAFSTQMQMVQIAEEINYIQKAVEEVRQGQEYDRLATAYSCQQKLLQAMDIKNPELKNVFLLRLVADAEDSRNLLMQSQKVNIEFIKNQPETFIKKLISGEKIEKINSRMNEIRESLCAVNMVSFVEAAAYQVMGEDEAAKKSLEYYARYIYKTYLKEKGLVDRLDMIDPSPENYWTKALPDIGRKIEVLTSTIIFNIEEKDNGEEM